MKIADFLYIYQDFSAREIHVKFHLLEKCIKHAYHVYFYFYFFAFVYFLP